MGSGLQKHFTASKLQCLPSETRIFQAFLHVPAWNCGSNALKTWISAHFQSNKWGISTKFGWIQFWTWKTSRVRDCLMWNSFPNAKIQKRGLLSPDISFTLSLENFFFFPAQLSVHYEGIFWRLAQKSKAWRVRHKLMHTCCADCQNSPREFSVNCGSSFSS